MHFYLKYNVDVIFAISEILLHGSDSMKAAHSPPPARLAAWVYESNTPLERATKELEFVQKQLNKLTNIFEILDAIATDNDVRLTANA